jgi:hypothetical protein
MNIESESVWNQSLKALRTTAELKKVNPLYYIKKPCESNASIILVNGVMVIKILDGLNKRSKIKVPRNSLCIIHPGAGERWEFPDGRRSHISGGKNKV